MRALAGRVVWAWEIFRMGFGVACYGLFALLVARVLRPGAVRWAAFLVGTFGGGVAWVVAPCLEPATPDGGWLARFVVAEEDYGWWCLNLFRQALYPLELLYHALFFAVILALIHRRQRTLLLLVFLLWWTHPITALLASTVALLSVGCDLARRRDRSTALLLIAVATVMMWHQGSDDWDPRAERAGFSSVQNAGEVRDYLATPGATPEAYCARRFEVVTSQGATHYGRAEFLTGCQRAVAAAVE